MNQGPQFTLWTQSSAERRRQWAPGMNDSPVNLNRSFSKHLQDAYYVPSPEDIRINKTGLIFQQLNPEKTNTSKTQMFTICRNMDGSRNYHTKWSRLDRERQISYDHLYVESRKWNKWLYSQNRLTDKTNLWLWKGKGCRQGQIGSLGLTYILLYLNR